MNSEASTSVVWESAAAAVAVGGGVHASTPTRHRGASSSCSSSSSSSSSGNSGSGTSSLLVRIARIEWKDAAYCYICSVVVSVACVSFCLSVADNYEPSKNGSTNRDAVRDVDSGYMPKDGGGARPFHGKGKFWGHISANCEFREYPA